VAETKIEWTITTAPDGSVLPGFTFNAWVGCTKVSDACTNCYAEAWAKRAGTPQLWTGDRRRTTAAYWQQPLKWNEEAARTGIRRKVFCCSLADVFDNQVPSRWRDDLWHRIDQTPHLDWLLLTKRPQNIAKMLPSPSIGAPEWGDGWQNVWLGTTCEDQEHYRMRYRHLSNVPARIRFISYEPALGPLRLDWPLSPRAIKPDWVIVGGESGGGARPMDARWAKMVLDTCREDGIKFFMKQMGGVVKRSMPPIPDDLMVREMPA
jgi:protein gp37